MLLLEQNGRTDPSPIGPFPLPEQIEIFLIKLVIEIRGIVQAVKVWACVYGTSSGNNDFLNLPCTDLFNHRFNSVQIVLFVRAIVPDGRRPKGIADWTFFWNIRNTERLVGQKQLHPDPAAK